MAVIKRFVGAVEHVWFAPNVDNHEINLLFEIDVPELDSESPPQSREDHLEFLWSKPSDLATHNLQPAALLACLSNREEKYEGFWGTSI